MGINRRALFTDETAMFRYPVEPEQGSEVTIRFRTAKDDSLVVYLVHNHTEIKMYYVRSDIFFDYYECTIRLHDTPFRYYFEIESGKEVLYYTKVGVTKEFDVAQNQYHFCVIPGFRTPDWAKGAIFYQIFVDRFCNGDSSNDVLTDEYAYIHTKAKQISDWEALPDSFDVCNFYGGDLAGIWKKLDYLQGLGVDVIYLNPIFVSPSNHKYDAQDYDYIDPHYGVITEDTGELLDEDVTDNRKASRYISRVTSKKNLEASNDFFAALCQEIHSRGMRIILDGVFNHCGSFNKWLDREGIYENAEGYEKGAYISEESEYRTFFRFREEEWPCNGSYDGWWGHDTLPKLNYEESPKLVEYILNIARKWIQPPYCIDGWRLDVAADLGQTSGYNHQFWKMFRKAVKETNPEAIILAEHYGDPSAWIQGDEWDTVMNYDAFMEPVTWFLTGMEKHSDQKNDNMYGNATWFFQTMLHNMSKFHISSLQTAMNELSNHDHSRFLTRTNRMVGRLATNGAAAAGQGVNKAVLKEAVVIQMTWPGAPTIYYGDEAGVVGWTDPDNRRTYPWGKEDYELIEFHKYLSRIHKKYSCLKTGSVKPLMTAEHYICYGRFDEASQVIVAVNNSDSYRTVSIPVWECGVSAPFMQRLMVTWDSSYNVGQCELPVKNGMLDVELGPRSSQIFAAVRETAVRGQRRT